MSSEEKKKKTFSLSPLTIKYETWYEMLVDSLTYIPKTRDCT